MSRKMTIMYLICIVISCFVIWQAIYFFDIGGLRSSLYSRTHNIARTQHRMKSLATAIQVDFSEIEADIPKNDNELLLWLSSHSKNFRDYINEDWYDTITGNIVDNWGNPFMLEIASANEYVLISFGPNKKYDEKQGDDIVYRFNPYSIVNEKQNTDH